MYTLPLVTLRDCALLPGVRQQLLVGRPGTVATLNQVGSGEVVFLQQQQPQLLRPRVLAQLYAVGCVGVVVSREAIPGGERVLVDGVRRVIVRKLVPRMVQLSAQVEDAPALLTEDAGEAAQALLAQRAHLLELAVQPESAAQCIYALASGLAGPSARQPLLAASDLDWVLEEVLDQLDAAAGKVWLQ